MEIEYTLTESDVFALTKFRIQHVPRLRRNQRIRHLGYSVGFALIGLGLFATREFFLSAVSLTLALLWVLLFPKYRDWVLHRRIHKMYENEKLQATLESCTLRITDEGLAEETPLGDTRLKWDAIDDITRIPTHTFVTVAELPCVVVPSEQVVAGDHERFFDECMRRVQSASTQH
jgi:hypothetical protein